MTEVIQLQSFKRKQAAKRGFRPWSKRFDDKLDERTKLSDLSDKTLLFLISPGDQNIFALYELVMGIKNLGTASDFFQLDKSGKMEVIDISIHLLDQLRFECMRRLNWLEIGVEQPVPIVDLVDQYPLIKKEGPSSIPLLKKTHSQYQAYDRLADFEKETFIRKQIPDAIEKFKRRLRD